MRLMEKIKQLFSCRKESNTCVLLFWLRGVCWRRRRGGQLSPIKSGQPLSKKGDFELGWSTWLVDLAGLCLSVEPTHIP